MPAGGDGGGRELLLGGALVLGGSRVGHPGAGVHGGVVLEAEEAVDGGGVGGDPPGDAVEGAGDGAVEGVDEPVLGLGGVVEEGAEGGGGLGLGGEEEEPDPRGARGSAAGGGGGDAVVLVDEVVEVLVGGDGDERVEVLVGELVLEREGLAPEQRPREARVDVGERGVAVDGHDPGLPAQVAEGLVRRARDDPAPEAAHQAEPAPAAGRGGRGRRGGREGLVPRVPAAAAGGGLRGLGVPGPGPGAPHAGGRRRRHRLHGGEAAGGGRRGRAVCCSGCAGSCVGFGWGILLDFGGVGNI